MSQPPNTCVNHPDTAAKRKCYHCLAYICPTCQKRMGGHIFCSMRCYLRFRVQECLAGFKRAFLRLGLKLRKIGKSADRLTANWFFRLVFLGLLLGILYQTVLLAQITSGIPVPPKSPSLPPLIPTAELVQEGEWMTLAGGAPGYKVAVLLSDGVERDICSISENRFSFHFQPEEGSRSVQVQVFGDALPSLYTRAIPLPERGASLAAGIPDNGEGREIVPLPAIPEKEEPQQAPPARKTTPAESAAPASTVGGSLNHPGVLKDDISRGKNGVSNVAITFDGGSYDNAAGKILDVLKEKGLTATFFLTGEFMERHPEITRRIAREGHEVGNHTYSHLHLTTFGKNYRHETLPGVTRELVLGELLRNEDLFSSLTGRTMVKLWRAPYGEHNRTIRGWAAEAGYRHVSWTFDPETRKSLDSLDWVSDRTSALYLTSDQIIEKIISFDTETDLGLSGGIVLFHLGSERSQDHFYPKLEVLIDRIQERGYRIGPVSRLLEAGG